MPPFSKKKSSLRRMKRGVGRLMSTIDSMKETLLGEPSDETDASLNLLTPAAKLNPQKTNENDQEDLPAEIISDIAKEEAIIARETIELAEIRAELTALINDRDERIEYFSNYAQESTIRFQRMLQSTRDQLAGIDTRREDADTDSEAIRVDAAQALEIAEPPKVIEQPVEITDYSQPPFDLLKLPDLTATSIITPEALEKQKNALQDTLDSFAVDAFVYDVIVGPRITQFRVQPGIGVRVETITALQKNISLALATTSIRIQAPIPGEPFVGIEIGNSNAVPIRLRTILQSKAWVDGTYDIPLIMGLDIQGKPVITDLAKAPHLLIAGATGSGKSVCMSTLILSMLYTFKPDELELVLIDPKRVEFGLFKNVPHLIHSVVTDAKPAVQVLKWVVSEMERRYEVLADKQVRNINSYNQKAEQEDFKKMPFCVVIIDELADLMMTSKGDAEGALARIAQLSRAVGIHTIVATQRPSVNVITGIIKANFPTRIAFQVSSNVDSRTILDCKGAESLLGQGDFLFNPPGIAQLTRIQSPYVEDQEIANVVEHIANQRIAEHRVDLQSIATSSTDSSGNQLSIAGIEGEGDEALLKKALLLIAESQKASTSLLQRRLRIGYNRAATLMEELEDRMHIGPQNGSTPREVFITPEEIEWCK